MSELSELLDRIVSGYPQVVIDLTGPWFDRGSDEPVWIANFKERDHGFEQVFSGASAHTPELALEGGLVFLSAWKKVRDEEGNRHEARDAGDAALDEWERGRLQPAISVR